MRTLHFILAICLGSAAFAEEWPMFRGPNGAGVSGSTGLPVKMGPGKNQVWKTPVPFARSSAIVAGTRIFLTASEEEKLITLCLARDTGKVLWRREIVRPRAQIVYRMNDAASPTPASDGDSLYVFFPDLGLLSYGFDGQERWRLPLGPFNNFYGMAGSPAVAADKVILICDQQSHSFLVAVDKKSGKISWRTERPEMGYAYATPVLYTSGTQQQVIITGLTRVDGYSPESGKLLWSVRGTGFSIYGVPAINGATLYVNGEGADQPMLPSFANALQQSDANKDGRLTRDEVDKDWQEHFGFMDADKNGYVDEKEWSYVANTGVGEYGLHAIRLGGNGDVTGSHVRWRLKKNLPEVPSPLFYKDVLYIVKDGGIITTVNPETGQILKEGRTKEAIAKYFSSPVAGDDKVYLTSEDGKITVLKAGREWEILAVNDLGEECYATPAIADGRIFVRTRNALSCYGLPRRGR